MCVYLCTGDPRMYELLLSPQIPRLLWSLSAIYIDVYSFLSSYYALIGWSCVIAISIFTITVRSFVIIEAFSFFVAITRNSHHYYYDCMWFLLLWLLSLLAINNIAAGAVVALTSSNILNHSTIRVVLL